MPDEKATHANLMTDEAEKESGTANSLNIAPEHHHLEAYRPSSILKHDGVICSSPTVQDGMHLPFKGDDMTNVLAIILQRDYTDVGVSASLLAATGNTDNLRVQAGDAPPTILALYDLKTVSLIKDFTSLALI